MKKLATGSLAVFFVLLLTTLSFATTIDLFGTGVDAGGALTVNGTADSHYALIGPSGNTATAKSVGNGHNAWVNPVTDGKSAQWITPGGTIGNVSQPNWTYTTTFTLDGLDAGTALISGLWSSDNGSEILLNGVFTGFTTLANITAFQSYHHFSISSGFLSGLNTLTFMVNNALNINSPSGLFVELISATAAPVLEPSNILASPVPEPSTLLLLGGGLFGLVCYGRKRMQA